MRIQNPMLTYLRLKQAVYAPYHPLCIGPHDLLLSSRITDCCAAYGNLCCLLGIGQAHSSVDEAGD
jgi:hypothetical protein